MYRLMIADDEIDKLESLRDNYNWEKSNIQICCEAQDGMEAYEQLVKEQPDICIMDIKMPVIDGLEAIKRAKDQGVNTKFIMLSGYDDFHYAQQALRLSTIEYLLKPCKLSDIMQAVLKCVNQIEEERRQMKLIKNYRNLFNGYLENLKYQFLVGLITGKQKAGSDFSDKITRYNLDVLTADFAVCTIIFDQETLRSYSSDSAFAQIIEIINKKLSRHFELETFVYNNQIVLIVSMHNILASFDDFVESLSSITTFTKLHIDLNCSIGISDVKCGAAYLYEAFQEADLTAEAAIFSFDRDVVFFAEMEKDNYQYPIDAEKKVMAAIGKDENQIHQAVDEFFSDCKRKISTPKMHTQNMATILVYNILKTLLERNQNSEGLSEKINQTVRKILNGSNLENIKETIVEFILSFTKQSGKKNTSLIGQTVVSYLHNNYSKKISLESVADAVHVTPSYLSTLFKQQTGLNLIEYLNRYRIENSKALLGDINLKIYEVAYQVGFQDEKYFYLLFKRYTGLTAMQYRNSILEFESVS